jgi:tetratricopeptide (TPR) repeat protein
MFNFKKRKAQKLHALAQQMHDDGQESKALEWYFKAIELDPEKAESYYNVGLIHKYRGEWELSLKYNQIANTLRPDDEAARWNLAIAATALRRWDIARSAWLQNGMKLEGDAGPINMNFGMTPVRLNPDDDAEVVWATRIDPVRARIDSIPFPESGFRFGDIVLHDGAAVGRRVAGDRQYPVFNVLELFESSTYGTAVANVELTKEDDLGELADLLSADGHQMEDWTVNIRVLCKQCSEGTPHDHHDDEDNKRAWQPVRKLGIALCESESVSSLIESWQRRTGAGLTSLEIFENLQPRT